MGELIDITGQRFNRLIVINRDNEKQKWKCKCDCGNYCFVSGTALRKNQTKSCGCLNLEKTIERNHNKKIYNIYDLSGEYGIGYDSKGNEFYFDISDYDLIRDYTWRVNNKGYVVAIIGNKEIKMHRLITNCNNDVFIDHIHGNRNDNRRSELRVCTQEDNAKNRRINNNNTTGAKGITILPSGKYFARIQCNGDRITIGTFDTIKEAADAYDKKAIELFGEYARLNNYNEQLGG